MADAWVINPLYSEREVRRVFDRPKDSMEQKDEFWQQCRDEFVRVLQARTATRDGDLPVPMRGDENMDINALTGIEDALHGD